MESLRNLLTLGLLIVATQVMAADDDEWVDCTNYIQNPGFDEDISFNNDGSAAKALNFAYEWIEWISQDGTGRSANIYTTEDGSIYCQDTSGKQGYNAAGYPNWDGFRVNIKGWELTNTTDEPLWIYYGSIPYNLGEGMMLLGNGNNGEGNVPEKPAAINTNDNTGVLFLKAGWLNSCTYKQTVHLPTAKYILSYYIRNTNVAMSQNYAEATNRCNVTCDGVTFVDTEGFNSEGWIKHTIDFIPVDSFTIEFGCTASNDYSYRNPILWVDGIELHRTGKVENSEINEAYKAMIEKADSLVALLHFAADKNALQRAIDAVSNAGDDAEIDRLYASLHAAIQMGETSEAKYSEVVNYDGVLHNAALALSQNNGDMYGGAKSIVRFAYTNINSWMVSEVATYIDADSYVDRLNAYANLYAPTFVEAEHFADSIGVVRAKALTDLMENQKASLTKEEMLSVPTVQEYVNSLRTAMIIASNPKKCATPTISYADGKLSLDCETENAECVWAITCEDVLSGRGNTISLANQYKLTVYATAEGYDNSDIVTAILTWSNSNVEGDNVIHIGKNGGDVNQDGAVDVADIATVISIMATKARLEGTDSDNK